MPERDVSYRYVAVGPDGRKVRGVFTAHDEAAAYQRLRGQGLSPLRLRPGAPPRLFYSLTFTPPPKGSGLKKCFPQIGRGSSRLKAPKTR